VSKREQNPKAQEAELSAAGAARVFVDHGDSSRVKDRPQWVACMDYLRAGDVLLVRRLDRLGGTERILIETLHELEDKGVDIKSLTEPVIDTTTPMGRALFGIVAVFAQLRAQTPPATWETIAKTLHVSSASVRRALAQPENVNR
jgi:DNA invertase Pin-like site-specific DNA recombinase